MATQETWEKYLHFNVIYKQFVWNFDWDLGWPLKGVRLYKIFVPYCFLLWGSLCTIFSRFTSFKCMNFFFFSNLRDFRLKWKGRLTFQTTICPTVYHYTRERESRWPKLGQLASTNSCNNNDRKQPDTCDKLKKCNIQ